MKINEICSLSRKEILLMGGNSRAIDSSGMVMMHNGREAFAEKIDLRKFPRSKFVTEFRNLFYVLNREFKIHHGHMLWEDFSVISENVAFNGSSKFFFAESISDKEFLEFKPEVGDIDLMVPVNELHNLWESLRRLEGQQITESIRYIGNNKVKPESIVGQINAVFEFTQNGDSVFCQVDFEGAEFENHQPTEWAKFSHSADWDDITNGIKGVCHKFLLQSVASVVGIVENAIELTPASPVVSEEEIQKLEDAFNAANQLLEDLSDKKAITEQKKAIKKLEKQLKRSKPKIPVSSVGNPVSRLTFSVRYGLREKMKQQFLENRQPHLVDGKVTFKAQTPEESGYESDPVQIFETLFFLPPDEGEIGKFGSFTGMLDLIKRYLTLEEQMDIGDEFVRRLWGITPSQAKLINSPDDLKYAAQALERDSWEKDLEIKKRALDFYCEKCFTGADEGIDRVLLIYYGNNGEAYARLRSKGKQ